MKGGGVDLREFIGGFLAEADEHLRGANASLLAVETSHEAGEANPRAVRDLFRALHTIKGLAAMVGVEPIVEIAHAMEAVLRAADGLGGGLAKGAVEPLLAGLRAIEQRVGALAEGKSVAAAPAALIEALATLEADATPATSARASGLAPELDAKLSVAERGQIAAGISRGAQALQVDFTPTRELAEAGHNITSVRERIGAVGEIVKVFPVSVAPRDGAPGGLTFTLLVITSASEADVAAAAGPANVTVLIAPSENVASLAPASLLGADDSIDEKRRGAGSLRVDVARLDRAMDALSALVVTRLRLVRAVAALAATGVEVREIGYILDENARQLRDLRASVLQLRMVSIGELLEAIPLLVRGLRRSTGKAVRVEIEGAQAELDKSVAERVLPAIMHLVRNAIDHGVESAVERRAAGKPEEAVVRIACVQRSNARLDVTVSDDGRGIDREAVARRAGRSVPGDDAALLELLALPGLTTRDQATTTSGRGFGMDIVRRVAVAELGGELTVHSRPGEGTAFTMRVPLTVAVVDMFRFACAGQDFVVPVATIEEIIEVDPEHIVRVPSPRAARTAASLVERRGGALPLVSLGERFAIPGAGEARKAFVVLSGGRALAFGVDRVLGQYEVVVRPLVDPLVSVTGVTGTTDLGDGRPTLVVDLVALGGALDAEVVA